MKRILVVLVMLLWFAISPALSSPSAAGEPTNELKQTVDAILGVVTNKELKKPGKAAERRAKIRRLANERFDFGEMAKRSLAQQWKKRTPEEQKEFVRLYTDLIENTYVGKIERYEGEKIAYGEEKIDGDYALVKTEVITTKGTEVPIDYRMLKEGNQWKIYDVIVEGVSLVNNYRTQFSSIIRSSSYGELVKRLKSKSLREPS
ncbi:MAG: ABC transporter substrate-binding protein [Nitrospirae bacterium]|nr:ABC transporter substrate-binding protein [Nitrospirota bacterium]